MHERLAVPPHEPSTVVAPVGVAVGMARDTVAEAEEDEAAADVVARDEGSESPLQVPNRDWQPVVQ
jgi:hypothetical protein